MTNEDKQTLIDMCLKMPCMECGNREHEYITTNMLQGSMTVPDVPTIRCNSCRSLSYPSFAYDYMDSFTS